MDKTCVWCGATLAETDRVCGQCLSAQPSTPQDVSPPPAPYPPAPYPGYAGYGPPAAPPTASNTGRTVAIVIGACVFGVVAIAFVCILAITFLGQKSSSKFVAIDPTGSVPSGTGRDYPSQVRANFLTNCETGASVSRCSCALEKIEDTYTLSEFTQVEQDYVSSGRLPASIAAIMSDCVASN